ncbi:hypothetical protein sos41_14890 [Alphaproteobacteria bacterium SO-S41]|nr:hypothetical protein sos41_14890 [Alphaproteobacteria bacterium SO-S41]
MSGVLSLSTYPIKKPRHGGQRRITAFAEFYRSIGLDFHYACIFEPANYSNEDVGADDLPLGGQDREFGDLPFVGDLLSGRFAGESDVALEHFASLIARLKPEIVQLDHPFLWPLVARLRSEGRYTGKVIYSSHNYEAPLKESILHSVGVSQAKVRLVREAIVELERACVLGSDLIVTVSESDALQYRAMAPAGAAIRVMPNGVDRMRAPSAKAVSEVRSIFGDKRFCLFVGSAYPPNIEGFAELVAKGGLFFTPPEKSFAVCGGVSRGIFNSREYGRFVVPNSDRVHFFPDIDDEGLNALKALAHVILLPIEFGGGSNLKTAEALVSGKHIVATPTALRGFEGFANAVGIDYAGDARGFRAGIMRALNAPALVLSAAELAARDVLYWDKAFINSAIAADVAKLLA